jgi:hypothetical protein
MSEKKDETKDETLRVNPGNKDEDVLDIYKDFDKNTYDAFINELSISNTVEDTEKTIEKYFPGLISYKIKQYSKDYPTLASNWNVICDKLKTTPKDIILLKKIVFENREYTLLNTICELLTRKGYCVRREGEFSSCFKCEGAIPCIEIWQNMKNRGLKVPNTWSSICRNC